MTEKITNEEIFELYWEGPFTKKEFMKQLKRKKAPKSWTLYAMCDDHPLYGENALTYIGKAVKQDIGTRVNQHNWWARKIYVASVFKFKNWNFSNNHWRYRDALTGEENDPLISRVEELLIYSLSPAYNQRNKNTAKNSETVRVFNTGDIGILPNEISGFYQLEHVPDPVNKDGE